MSAKRNRRRASKTRRRQTLLSLRAELVLLFDGEPVPPAYLTYRLEQTCGLINAIKYYGRVPAWMKWQQSRNSEYQAQIDKAAMQLQMDIDTQIIIDLTKRKDSP